MLDRQATLNEIRYAERLCQRTARLYRRTQTFGVFLAIAGGSATLSSPITGAPAWVSTVGAIVLTVIGAALIAIRVADKAALNEFDAKRYTALRAKASRMSDEDLRVALDELRSGDVPEIESLRDVVYNDVAVELGRADYVVPLGPTQRLLAVIA